MTEQEATRLLRNHIATNEVVDYVLGVFEERRKLKRRIKDLETHVEYLSTRLTSKGII